MKSLKKNIALKVAIIGIATLLFSVTCHGAIVNGDFGISDTGNAGFAWSTRGEVSIIGGEVVLSEGYELQTSLWQTFDLPVGISYLTFTLTGLNLQANDQGELIDAFEVRLLDATTGHSLVDVVTSMSGTDAFLNLQQTGEVHYGDQVSVPGASASGESWSPDMPVTVTVDLTSIAESRPATLYFDLLGFGVNASSVQIDNVRLVAPAPVAQDNTATTDEDVAVVFDTLKYVTDVDGFLDPATVNVFSGPSHGYTAVNKATGAITYTPAENFFGDDSFTYNVCDNDGNLSNTATVTVTITSINDVPVADAGLDQTVSEGVTVTLNGSVSTDVEGTLTYLWKQIETEPFVTLSSSTAIQPTFTAPEVGPAGVVLTFELTVTDTGNLHDTDTVAINISNVVIPGDVDDSGAVDLADGILCLKIMAKIDISGRYIAVDADVNGDGKIGLEEAVYILQKISELRE